MPQTKATKKFEKRHLKDTLERRKGLKKTKQQQQLKARKKARRAEENGTSAQLDDENEKGQQNGRAQNAKDVFQDMSVDDFFQGGFEIPELPAKKGSKRKRVERDQDEEDSDASSEKANGPKAASESQEESEDEDDWDDHKQQLDALAQNDPEFHKYLQENEPELLDATEGLDGLDGLSEDEDEEEPQKKKQRRGVNADDSDEGPLEVEGKNELKEATVKKWHAALTKEHSLRAAREVVLAFRAAAHGSDVEEEKEQQYKYSISDPDVYHQLLTLALKHIPAVFEHHLPVQEGKKNGKAHVATESKKFKVLTPLLRGQIGSILHLLSHLSDPATLKLTLSSTLPLLPYLLSFKKLVRDLIKSVANNVFSAPAATESTRIAAFLVLRRLTAIGDAGIRESVFKQTYQALIRGSRNTTVHTIAGINLMKNSAAELWGLDTSVGYTTGFTFIRQLAIHLRSSIQHPGGIGKNKKGGDEGGYKAVYNWQCVHGLDFWSRVLSAHCGPPDAPLRPLIYPLVQVTLGAWRLIPTATYFPLRFQLTRSLLRLSRTTGTYIPLAAPLYEVLNSAEMRKAPKPSTLKPLDFDISIRVPKSYLRTRTYQDGVGDQVQELLGEFFALWCKNIAFPELSLPVIVMLKRWLKDANNRASGKGNKNQKVNGMISLLVQKVEANAKFVEEKRAKVEFAPNNRKGVEGFLGDVALEKTPLGAFVGGQRKTREEKRRVLEEGRREEEGRKDVQRRKGKSGADIVEEEESDIDEEEEEEEEGEEEMDGDSEGSA